MQVEEMWTIFRDAMLTNLQDERAVRAAKEVFFAGAYSMFVGMMGAGHTDEGASLIMFEEWRQELEAFRVRMQGTH